MRRRKTPADTGNVCGRRIKHQASRGASSSRQQHALESEPEPVVDLPFGYLFENNEAEHEQFVRDFVSRPIIKPKSLDITFFAREGLDIVSLLGTSHLGGLAEMSCPYSDVMVRAFYHNMIYIHGDLQSRVCGVDILVTTDMWTDLLGFDFDAAVKSNSQEKPQVPTSEPLLGPQISAVDAYVHMDSGIISSDVDAYVKVAESPKATVSGTDKEYESQEVLSNLPQEELRLLCSLLAQEGLSDNAEALVAEVMKKLVANTPNHCQLFVTELTEEVQKLTSSAMNELHVFSEVIEALLSTSSSDGAAILREREFCRL